MAVCPPLSQGNSELRPVARHWFPVCNPIPTPFRSCRCVQRKSAARRTPPPVGQGSLVHHRPRVRRLAEDGETQNAEPCNRQRLLHRLFTPQEIASIVMPERGSCSTQDPAQTRALYRPALLPPSL